MKSDLSSFWKLSLEVTKFPPTLVSGGVRGGALYKQQLSEIFMQDLPTIFLGSYTETNHRA